MKNTAAAGIINTDRLPLRQTSSGTWELRKRVGNGKRLEVSLGTKRRDIAEERAQKIMGTHTTAVMAETWAERVHEGLKKRGWLQRIHSLMRYRCGKKGWSPPSIGVLEIAARRSGGHCEVSGIDFHMGASVKHPFQPSIDRIDSSKGYELDNIRLVCLVVNFCMSQWGEAVFHVVAAATVRKYLEKLATGYTYSAQTGGNQNNGGRPRNSVTN